MMVKVFLLIWIVFASADQRRIAGSRERGLESPRVWDYRELEEGQILRKHTFGMDIYE